MRIQATERLRRLMWNARLPAQKIADKLAHMNNITTSIPSVFKNSLKNVPRHRIYLFFQALTIVAVALIFRYIANRHVAALLASSLFFSVSLGPLYNELMRRSKHWWWSLAHLQFLVFFAAPILILRLMFWQTEFSQIEINGVPWGVILHRYSNLSFSLMMLANLIVLRIEHRKTNNTRKEN